MKNPEIERYSSFIDRLASLFETMDQKYGEATNHYDFHCAGCDDNCCKTRFFHHTYLEFFYIGKGFSTLELEKQGNVLKKAAEVYKKTREAESRGEKARILCPLNSGGSCLLYAYRPMICRLHGISHELHIPNRMPIHAPGCEAFTRQTLKKSYLRFDRTPFYAEMSKLEAELKNEMGSSRKLKMSVAEMLVTML